MTSIGLLSDYGHMEPDKIITLIEQASVRLKLSPTTITARAVGNSRLYARLRREGGYCSPKTAKRLEAWIEERISSVDEGIKSKEVVSE